MEHHILDRIYDFVSHILHHDHRAAQEAGTNPDGLRRCPVTHLDISMQPKNSKFLSASGVMWYFEHQREVYNKLLKPRLSERMQDAGISKQCREIAHSIRNSISNPRNNTKKAIKKLLNEKDCLFSNRNLIDKNKMIQAGFEIGNSA
ncbi:MAG TPA: hypothetical protein DDX98_04895 [Bacteroidales bacterium]|nr:hypothetical protein [Bacteroidales bacterium]